MLTRRELMNLADYLALEEHCVRMMNELATNLNDEPLKRCLQRMAKENEDSFALLGSYINAGEKLHMRGI